MFATNRSTDWVSCSTLGIYWSYGDRTQPDQMDGDLRRHRRRLRHRVGLALKKGVCATR